MKKRKYKSGTRWCLWRWSEVDSEYIVRLHLIKTPWFAICLHWILKPDPEPYLHDHPVSFLSLILRGGYTERRGVYQYNRAIGFAANDRASWAYSYPKHTWYNYIRATRYDRHSIIEVKPKTLTLCFMGPKTREWGFHTKDGWMFRKDYYAIKRTGKQP